MRPGFDHNGCTCSTIDPWATSHRNECPHSQTRTLKMSVDAAKARDAYINLEARYRYLKATLQAIADKGVWNSVESAALALEQEEKMK